jgi:uncharacterized protein (DUF488 family)
VKLYTIGFAGKSAERFFGILTKNGVQKVVDVRVRPSGQLAGFASKRDLPYLLSQLVSADCEYVHVLEFAPTAEMMRQYRDRRDWPGFARSFEDLLDERRIPGSLPSGLIVAGSCLLCAEESAEACHRTLVAERLRRFMPDVEVVHLR